MASTREFGTNHQNTGQEILDYALRRKIDLDDALNSIYLKGRATVPREEEGRRLIKVEGTDVIINSTEESGLLGRMELWGTPHSRALAKRKLGLYFELNPPREDGN